MQLLLYIIFVVYITFVVYLGMQFIHFIYLITDKTNTPIYIGRTCNARRRFWAHKSSATLIGELLRGGDAEMTVIDKVDIKMVIQMEKYWVCQMQQWGFSLLNKKITQRPALNFKQ